MEFLKLIVASIIGAALVFGASFFVPGSPEFGALDSTTFTNPIRFNNTVRLGTNGATITELKAATCNLIGTDASQLASTTAPYDCAVTGVASGDVIMAQLATSTSATGQGWSIKGSLASTTAGYVTVLLSNETGANKVPSATSVGSSTQVWYMDN